jgi:uncharacterized RDD family membrane protein YckC
LTGLRSKLKSMTVLKRFIAYFIDLILCIVVFYFYVITLGTKNAGGGYHLENVLYLPLILYWYFYFTIPEIIWKTTFGKRLLSLYVVKQNNSKFTISDVLLRRSLDFLELFFFPMIAMVAVFVTRKNQRLGDLLAKTEVVYLPKKGKKF